MVEINKKSFLGYSEKEVKQYLDGLEKEYTQQVQTKRKKLREIIDKNNDIQKYLDRVSDEKNKIGLIVKKDSQAVNACIKEINAVEKELGEIKQEEEQKRITEHMKLKQKVKELNDYCNVLSRSYIELTAFIKRYKVD